jgi:hypothetical protein
MITPMNSLNVIPDIWRGKPANCQDAPKVDKFSERTLQNGTPNDGIHVPENSVSTIKLTDREKILVCKSAAGTVLGLGLVGAIVENFSQITSGIGAGGHYILQTGKGALSGISNVVRAAISSTKAVGTSVVRCASSIASCAASHPFIATGCVLGGIAFGATIYYLAKRKSAKGQDFGRKNFEQLVNGLDHRFMKIAVGRNKLQSESITNQMPRPSIDYGLGGVPLQGFSAEQSQSSSPTGSTSASLEKLPRLKSPVENRQKHISSKNDGNLSPEYAPENVSPRRSPRLAGRHV